MFFFPFLFCSFVFLLFVIFYLIYSLMLSIRISFTAKPQCLELPWEIEITTSYKGFELKDQKHSIKEVLCLYKFHWKVSRNLRE